VDDLPRSNNSGNPLGEGRAPELTQQIVQVHTEATKLPPAHGVVQKGIIIICHSSTPRWAGPKAGPMSRLPAPPNPGQQALVTYFG
jgi:hypothetical protein